MRIGVEIGGTFTDLVAVSAAGIRAIKVSSTPAEPERGVFDALQRQGLAPRIEMEATNTDLIVRMVEAGLGVGVVPLHSSGAVTRGRRLGIRDLGQQIRPIDSGILTRKGEHLSAATRQFVAFVRAGE